ncbi:MAG: zf-HC2 domain-containing protein [bacterium]
MKCCKVRKMLSAYLDEELSEKKMRQIQIHLTKCAVCSWELNSFRKIDELGHLAANNITPDMPDSYWENYNFTLSNKLRACKAGSFRIHWLFTILFASDWLKKAIPVIAGAAVILLLITIVNLIHNEPVQVTRTEIASTPKVPPENSYTKPDNREKTSDKIAINFYIREYEDAIIKTFYSSQPSAIGVEIDSDDMLYYDVVKGSGKEL